MSIGRSRLDRFISQHCQINKRDVRLMIAQQRIVVDGNAALSVEQAIDKFSKIELDGKSLQDNQPLYLMLHKPIGVVSATKDKQHQTVLDLLGDKLTDSEIDSLHLVGRLDLNTSGLVLLTNDSRWSERLTKPSQKVAKKYRVTLGNEVLAEQQQAYIEAFAMGMYFGYENITTQAATLSFLSTTVAELTLIEGRYHQIKRMFGRFRNPVIALHRFAIGSLYLIEELPVGAYKRLTEQEAKSL